MSARSNAKENDSNAANANEKTGSGVREGVCETAGSRMSASLSVKSSTILVDVQDAVVGRLPSCRAFENAYTTFTITNYEL